MSRHVQRWYNHQSRAESQIRDLYLSAGPIFGMTHADMLARRAEIIATIPKGAPSWVHCRLSAIGSALLDEIMRREIRWQLYLDGAKVDSSAVPTGAWCRVTGRQEWIRNGRPFSPEDYVGPSSCAVRPDDPRVHVAPCA